MRVRRRCRNPTGPGGVHAAPPVYVRSTHRTWAKPLPPTVSALIRVTRGYSVITWWNGSFGDSTQIAADQVRQNATQYRRAGNIVIGKANFPAVTTVYDDVIRLTKDRALTTVTLAEVFTTTPT